jgi:hypothetical protein
MSDLTNVDAVPKYEWAIEDTVDSFYTHFENKLNASNKIESSMNSNDQKSKTSGKYNSYLTIKENNVFIFD